MNDFYQIVKMFDDFFNAGLGNVNRVAYSTPSFPPTDLELDEKSKDATFRFALAGYKKDEIDIAFNGDYMSLTLTPKEEKTKEGKTILASGIKRRECEVRYYIPQDKYDTENAKASFEDGVLELFVPAREKVKERKLLIG